MKRINYLVIVIVLVSGAWYLGKPGNPPAPTNILLPKAEGSVKGATSDRMPPVSHFLTKPKTAHKGTILVGEASDLGSGVAQVVYQIQRNRDGAVWDGSKWQGEVGVTQETALTGRNFTITIPVALLQKEQYVIRTQAIDNAGNPQSKWEELMVTGTDLAQTISTN